MPSPRLASVSGHRPGDGAGTGERFSFGGGHVRRMDGAPASVYRQQVQQIFDRTATAPGEAVLDFSGLFGNVDVDRTAACERQDLVDLFDCRGAERVGCYADPGSWVACKMPAGAFHQAGEAVDVVDEPPLAGSGRKPAEAAMGVEDGQQRQADAGGRSSSHDAPGHFGGIVVGLASRIMVEVVELAQRREAGLQHLRTDQRPDRLDIVGRQPVEESVHGLTPCPETVGAFATLFGQAGHGALKGVAVEIGYAGHHDPAESLRGTQAGADRHIGNQARTIDLEHHVTRPTLSEQRVLGEKFHGCSHEFWTRTVKPR